MLVTPLGSQLPAVLADLLDVFTAIVLADRQAPRTFEGDFRPPSERWHRRFEEVVIPVRQPDLWRSSTVRQILGDLLVFVTDDDWDVRFVTRTCDPRPAESQEHFLAGSQGTHSLTVLHSGGLDSLFALIEAAKSELADSVYAVSVVTNQSHRRVVDRVLAELRPTIPGVGMEGLRLYVDISSTGRPRNDRESTQRARSLLYLAAGVVAAILGGSGSLRVTENGPGAINLPCTPDQFGARATRAMHPKTLALFAKLASVVLDQHISIVNNGLLRTKGELAETVQDRQFTAAVRQTVSCDHFPYRPAHRGCGTCGSCLYRRVALSAAGLSKIDDGRYDHEDDFDLLDRNERWEDHRLVHLVAQRELVERLRSALAAGRPFAALESALPMIDDVVVVAPELGMQEHQLQDGLVRLFNAFVRDADAFYRKIDRPGWGRLADVTNLTTPTLRAVAG